MPLLKQSKDGVLIEVLLQPAAPRTKILCVQDDHLKIQVTAPPVEGRANQALIEHLSKVFDVPKESVRIIRGEKSRHKQVIISGLTTAAVKKTLELDLKS